MKMQTKMGVYECPKLERIKMDNEISLTMTSGWNPWEDPSMSTKLTESGVELVGSALKQLIER